MKKDKIINICSWISVIIGLIITYFLILPVLGAAMLLGSIISGGFPPLIIIYLMFLLVSQFFITIPTLLFWILDKKIFMRNLKRVSLINIFVCILYAVEFSKILS